MGFNYAQGQTVFASEPVIGDIDGDGSLEVVFNTYDPRLMGATVGTWALKNDASVVNGFPLYIGAGGASAAPTLADLDGDGYLEIAVALGPMNTRHMSGIPLRPTFRTVCHGPCPARTWAALLRLHHHSQLRCFHQNGKRPGSKIWRCFTFTIRLFNSGPPLTSTLALTDVIPPALSYVPGTLKSSIGDATISSEI